MIKSTIPLIYSVRDVQKIGIISIEVASWLVDSSGITYTVNDYAVNGDIRALIHSKEVFRSWDQLNSLNDYLESLNDYSGMTKKEKEFMKVRHGLLLDTQTKPVYVSKAADWILIENDDL